MAHKRKPCRPKGSTNKTKRTPKINSYVIHMNTEEIEHLRKQVAAMRELLHWD